MDGRKTGRISEKTVLAAIIVLFGFTRLWQLARLPYGLHIDEAGMAYDAWCLSQYGVDRYLKSWPVYLTNLGGGQSSLYAFLCAFLFRLFGYNIWLVRLPGVVFSFLALIFGMKLTKKLYPQNPFMSMAVGGLLTICPYFILAARFGLDCNLMLGMSTVFLYCFFEAIESRRMGRYLLAGVTGGIVLYTYALTYIILPFFLLLMLIYLLWVKRFSLKGWAVMAVPMGILAVPLILVQIVNFFDLEEFQIACFTITKLKRYRASEVGFFSVKKLVMALFSILAGDFLGEPLQYNTAPGYANLYAVTIPFFVIGVLLEIRRLWKAVKKRELQGSNMVLLWLAVIIIFESHVPANVNRINSAFFAAVFLTVEGMSALSSVCSRFRRWVPMGLTIVYAFCFMRFSGYYYGGSYTEQNYMLPYFDLRVSEAIEYIEQDEELRGRQTQMSQVQIYYALSTLESPYVLRVENGDGMSYGNYRFGVLGEIEDDCNYIVGDWFENYSEELRAAGFAEECYDGYSLFFKK